MHPAQDFTLHEGSIFAEASLIQDLELNTIFTAMALEDKFLFNVVKKTIVAEPVSKEIILYRQGILQDCVAHPQVIRDIYQLPLDVKEEKSKAWIGIRANQPSTILFDSLQALSIYFVRLRKLRGITDKYSNLFYSSGFKRFFSMIQDEFNDEYLDKIKNLITELKFTKGLLISANIGTGNEIINYIMRKEQIAVKPWYKQFFQQNEIAYTYYLDPHDLSGAQSLNDLRNNVLNEIANVVAQSADHIDNFFKQLQLELAFYMGCLNLQDQLSSLHEPITFPEVKPIGDFNHSFTGLTDLSLALTVKKKVVGNDLDLLDHSLIIITGANQGGKSTFLRSIGIAQLLMQSGMFVSAESYSSNICSNIFTHFKREEDSQMESGKLDEELERMSSIITHITSNSLLLFNESFASTNEREGTEIAKQIVDALLEQHIKIFFVTHLYALADYFFTSQNKQFIFLRAIRNDDGSRPFKLQFGKPLTTSFGKDLYNDLFNKNEIEGQDELSVNPVNLKDKEK